jgi:hypothetical protein
MQTSIKHFAPENQPSRVFELAERLLAAYKIDGGNVHLAGCRLDNCPFLRVTAEGMGRKVVFYLDPEGLVLESTMIERLGVDRLAHLAHPPEQYSGPDESLIDRAKKMANVEFSKESPPERVQLDILWCKFATGRLRFTIGDESLDVPFSGWSRLIEPPPVVCPISGENTFHLAATDDGRIMAAESIGQCDLTGQRLPTTELTTCNETGKTVHNEKIQICPVTGSPVLIEKMVSCDVCGEMVAPSALERGQCVACRQLEVVRSNDPCRQLLLEKHPGLAQWRRWQLAQTRQAWILGLGGWMRRVRIVLDSETLEIKRIARRAPLSGKWEPVAPEDIGLS